jgi:uncharacterized protein (DUF362 family)
MDRANTSSRGITRRTSLRWLGLAGAGLAAAACAPKPTADEPATVQTQPEPAAQRSATQQSQAPAAVATQAPAETGAKAPTAQPKPASGETYLAAVHGADPAAITAAALMSIGGIERFVKKGFDVIIKPNICTDYNTYEYASTTNPVVIATLVKLALGAGAKRVRVMDHPFGGTAESAYARSGIEEAVKAAGGQMEVMNPNKFKNTKIPQGVSIQEWLIYQEILACDLMINVPIAKNHSLARLTLGGKNLLGVIEDRGSIHSDFGQRIPDLISVIKPGLTVVDAVRILMDHGPTGGSLDDVKLTNTVIASHDIVAADSYATSLFGMTANDIEYVSQAAVRGLGIVDLKSVKVEEITL